MGSGGAARVGEAGGRILSMSLGAFVRSMFGPYERRVSDAYRSFNIDLDSFVARTRESSSAELLEKRFGEAACAAQARFTPWRNNIATLVQP